MKLEVKNKNYCATVVEIKKLVPLNNCDNVQSAIILNSAVVVSKDVQIGDVGLFFPVETSLSQEFLSNNNLFREKTLNKDQTKGGFFELNGRIRCVKFRGNSSEGFYIPLSSLDYIDPLFKKSMKVGDEFDQIDNNNICEKYIVRVSGSGNLTKGKSGKKPKSVKRESKLIDGLFRLHYDTAHLKKNLHNISSDTLISISDKWHGTSLVVSNILTKKKLNWKEKITRYLGVDVKDSEYSMVYSSRKVIKNEFQINKTDEFYKEDIWGEVSKEVYPLLQKGMTAYCEIVGYLSSGGEIQKSYNYGCLPNTHKVVVYRITITNEDGKVIELPFIQMKDYCEKVGLTPVELIFYGRAKHFIDTDFTDEEDFRNKFLQKLESDVQHKKCKHHNFKVPMEGYVVKIDGINESTAFKYKNIDFLEFETKQLDKGEVDIETNEEN